MKVVTQENFAETVKQGIVVLDWWAEWCGPCRAFAPIFEKAAAAHPDVVFGKINTDEQRELSAAFEIRSIPTLMALRDGVLLFAQPGMLPEAAIAELIEKLRALDMDEVRREIEAESKKED
jgi:thioredoxin 1